MIGDIDTFGSVNMLIDQFGEDMRRPAQGRQIKLEIEIASVSELGASGRHIINVDSVVWLDDLGDEVLPAAPLDGASVDIDPIAEVDEEVELGEATDCATAGVARRPKVNRAAAA